MERLPVVEELLRSGALGTHLTQCDWELEIKFNIEEGNFEKSTLAAFKAGTFLSKKELENLLLEAILRGRVSDVEQTLESLNRKATDEETHLLLESAVLFGNISGVLGMLSTENLGNTALLHTTMAIAVAKKMRWLREREIPYYISLASWVTVYAKELSSFNLQGVTLFIPTFPHGRFYVFCNDSLQELLGALIAFNEVTKEEAKQILSQKRIT